MSLSWTQPICVGCWDKKNPDRPSDPSRRYNEGDLEMCAYCGAATRSGIYVRDDPANVRFPQEKS